MRLIEECPVCGSLRVGSIEEEQTGYRNWAKQNERMLSKGSLTHFVSGERYRNYYQKLGIDAHCFDCHHDFKSAYATERKLAFTEYQEYQKDMGMEEMKAMLVNENKKACKRYKIKKALRNFFL